MVSGLGRIPFVDAHCHVYGISKERLRKIVEEIVIVGVAEDYETSRRIIELSQQLPNIVPMIGLHPWKVPSVAEEELRNILSLIDRARGLGEIGLDGKTRALDKQIRFFEEQLKVASEYDLPVNIHSRAAWQEIANLLLKYEISYLSRRFAISCHAALECMFTGRSYSLATLSCSSKNLICLSRALVFPSRPISPSPLALSIRLKIFLSSSSATLGTFHGWRPIIGTMLGNC